MSSLVKQQEYKLRVYVNYATKLQKLFLTIVTDEWH